MLGPTSVLVDIHTYMDNNDSVLIGSYTNL